VADPNPPGERGLQEALRAAVERTLAATAGSAAQQRGRAQELLDEVARRGQEARERVARRGQEAREASASVTGRLVETIQDMRTPSAEQVRALDEQLAAIERRVEALERRLRDDSRPRVEPEGEDR
jgi:polyhydroxyalkanoate synthesis regulator phasin